jgi:hypothetical protein
MTALWSYAAGLAWYSRKMFTSIAQHPVSKKKIEEKIARLKEMLVDRTRKS